MITGETEGRKMNRYMGIISTLFNFTTNNQTASEKIINLSKN